MEMIACISLLPLSLALMAGLWLCMRAYIALARKRGIVNGSGNNAVVTGGGIVIPIAYAAAEFYHLLSTGSLIYPWFFIGLAVIATVSFVDDIDNLSPMLRLAVHFLCCSLLIFQIIDSVPSFRPSALLIAVLLTCTVAVVNTFNFLDGIKGITGCYALTVLIPPLFFTCHAINDLVIIAMVCAVIVFSAFNFRTPERCYCGDTGSISLGYFIAFYLLLQAVSQHSSPDSATITCDFTVVALAIVYLVDFSLTLLIRSIRRENLLQSHHSHLYQRLAFEGGVSHMRIALGYAATQLAISIVYILVPTNYHLSVLVLSIFALTGAYTFISLRLNAARKL